MDQVDIEKAIENGIANALPAAVQKFVNGKIDKITSNLNKHNEDHSADMKRILPIIEAFESSERRLGDARKAGKSILWIASFIVAVGSAVIIIKVLIKTLFFH